MEWDMMMPEAEVVADMLFQDLEIGNINDEDILKVLISDRSAISELLESRTFPCDRAGVQDIFDFLVSEEILQASEHAFEGEEFSEEEVISLIQSAAQAQLDQSNIS